MRGRPLVWITALLLVGCGSDNDFTLPPTNADVTGTFVLSSANGIAPPYTAFRTETEEWRLQSDIIVIRSNGTWTETTNYLVFTIGDSAIPIPRQIIVSGTYLIVDDKIAFSILEGGTSGFFGSVTGNALIVLSNGQQFTYTN